MKFFKQVFKLIIVPLIICIVIAFVVRQFTTFEKVGKQIDTVYNKAVGTQQKVSKAINKAGEVLDKQN